MQHVLCGFAQISANTRGPRERLELDGHGEQESYHSYHGNQQYHVHLNLGGVKVTMCLWININWIK